MIACQRLAEDDRLLLKCDGLVVGFQVPGEVASQHQGHGQIGLVARDGRYFGDDRLAKCLGLCEAGTGIGPRQQLAEGGEVPRQRLERKLTTFGCSATHCSSRATPRR